VRRPGVAVQGGKLWIADDDVFQDDMGDWPIGRGLPGISFGEVHGTLAAFHFVVGKDQVVVVASAFNAQNLKPLMVKPWNPRVATSILELSPVPSE